MASARVSEFVAIIFGISVLSLLGAAVTWLGARLQHEETRIVQVDQETLDQAREQAMVRATRDFSEHITGDDAPRGSVREIGYTASTRQKNIDQFHRILRSTQQYGWFNRGSLRFLRIVNAEQSGGIDRALDYLDTIEPELIALSSKTGKPAVREHAAARTLKIAAASTAAEGKTTEAARLYRKIVSLPVGNYEAVYEAGWFHLHNSYAELEIGLVSDAENSARESLSLGGLLVCPELSGKVDGLMVQNAARFQLGRIALAKEDPGSIEDASEHFELALVEIRLVIERLPKQVKNLRYVSNRFVELGDAFLARGSTVDIDRAVDSYLKAAELTRQNPAADRMATILEKLAKTYERRAKEGDFDLAIRTYGEALSFREEHHQSNPDSKESENAHMAVRGELARLYSERGDPGDTDRALEHHYRRFESTKAEMLSNPERLTSDYVKLVRKRGNHSVVSDNPKEIDIGIKLLESAAEFRRILDTREATDLAAGVSDVEWRPRDLPFILVKLGDTYTRRGNDGDVEIALSKYEEALAIWRKLNAAHPDWDVFKRDIAYGLEQVADARKALGGRKNCEQAIALYEEELRLSEEIRKEKPESVEAARISAAVHNKLAFGYAALDESDAEKRAVELHREAVRRQRTLFSENPDHTDIPRDLAVSLTCLGVHHFQKGGKENHRLGLESTREAIALLHDLRETLPNDISVARSLITAHHDLWKHGEEAVSVEFAEEHARKCRQLIGESIDAGLVFDEAVLEVYDTLSKEFGFEEND